MNAKQSTSMNMGSVLEALAIKECESLQHALTLRKSRHDGIHIARKSGRRLRILLAFFRPQLDQKAAKLDLTLKQWVSDFSPLRDAHIATRTARILATTDKATLTPSLMETLEQRSEDLLKQALQSDPDWRERRANARRIATAVENLPWQQIDVATAKQVLKRSIRRMKKARKAALKKRTIHAFHRWRRRARGLRYQLEFLRKASRGMGMKKKHAQRYAARIKRLGLIIDRLGWRQDFQVFLKALDRLPVSEDVIALSRTLRMQSVALSNESPSKPKTKSERIYMAHGSGKLT